MSLSSFQQQTAGECSELRDGDQPCEHLGCLKAPSDALGPMGRAGPPGARRLLLLSTHFIKEKKNLQFG